MVVEVVAVVVVGFVVVVLPLVEVCVYANSCCRLFTQLQLVAHSIRQCDPRLLGFGKQVGCEDSSVVRAGTQPIHKTPKSECCLASQVHSRYYSLQHALPHTHTHTHNKHSR